MDIEVKRMSPTAIEMLDQLSAVCKRFALTAATICLPKGSTAADNAPPQKSRVK